MAVKRFLALFANDGLTPREIPQITESLKNHLKKNGLSGLRFGNIRVSSVSIQLDLFLDHASTTPAVALRVLREWRVLLDFVDLSVDRYEGMDAPQILDEALKLFNSERYWEFHEALETLWRSEVDGPRKDLLQGLILVAAALVHMQKNRDEVGLNIMRRALAKLRSVQLNVIGLEVLDPDDFVRGAETIVSTGRLKPFKVTTKSSDFKP